MKTIHNKTHNALISLLSVVFFSSATAVANPIELTVHHSPGGPSDTVTRFIAKNLSSDYIVQNRPGAQGRIAVRQILKGNSVLTATVPQIYVTNPLNFNDLEYNPEKDLEILATVATMPNLLACRSSLGFKTVDDFLKYEGRALSFAINGYGSAEHIATESLFTKTKTTHTVIPYATGGNKGTIDVIGGSVDCIFANLASIKPFLNDSRIDVLLSSHDMGIGGVSTWDKRFKESFPYQSYICLVVAKSMSDDNKKKIINDLNKVFADHSFKESLFRIGLLPIGSTELWMTNSVLKSNRSLERFIVNNRLNISQ
jgi:tripartite-type tricarboxylate transporter receptor subunit TctC